MFVFQYLEMFKKFLRHRLKWVIINDLWENTNSSTNQNKDNLSKYYFKEDRKKQRNFNQQRTGFMHTYTSTLLPLIYDFMSIFIIFFFFLSLWYCIIDFICFAGTWRTPLSNILRFFRVADTMQLLKTSPKYYIIEQILFISKRFNLCSVFTFFSRSNLLHLK